VSDSRTLTYTGTDIEIAYDPVRCLHAAECVKGLNAVFDPDRKPWVDPNRASPGEIAAIIERCPTGALRARRLDGGPEETPAERTTLRVAADGPFYARGDLRVELAGSEEPRVEMRAAFCRCGASSAKPFCDGAHEKIGFEDAGRVDLSRALPPESTEPAGSQGGEGDLEGEGVAPPGAIDVTPVANGPLRFEGVIEICGSGEASPGGRFAGAYLCRCGASANKPFCDGSHRDIEFVAEGF